MVYIFRSDDLVIGEDRRGHRFPGQDIESQAQQAVAVFLGEIADGCDQARSGGSAARSGPGERFTVMKEVFYLE